MMTVAKLLLPLLFFIPNLHTDVQPLSETISLFAQEQTQVYGSEYVLHAGGITPQGVVGSNSLEALNYSYERGYRVMEMDFCWTKDRQLVCVHDWDAYYTHRLNKESATMAEFENMRSSYGFTSMTLDHLATWLKLHPDVTIVTDIKENCPAGAKLIADTYPELVDQFWVQIYATDEYDTVYQLGFKNIILTVYQMAWDEQSNAKLLTDFMSTHQLVGLTFPVELIELVPGYLETVISEGTPVFVHTVNDEAEQQALFDSGISGIYTDGIL